jgi:predicted transposase YbfD/YdcC
MELLSDIDDPRQPSNGTRHDFQELLVMTLSAVLADCDTIEDVAAWSRAHTIWLRQFLVLKHGIPSEDTFLRVFRLLDPKQFEACFRRWVRHLIPNLGGTIAVQNGAWIWWWRRNSHSHGHFCDQAGSGTWSGESVGEEQRANCSMPLPARLSRQYRCDGLPTGDCREELPRRPITCSVKGNQPKLLQAIQDAFLDRKDQIVHVEQAEQGHGRLVAQRCSVLPATGIVPESDWPECAVIVRIDSVRQVKGKPLGMEQRYYIASRDLAPAEVAEAVRSHWGIENQLHWVLDVTMKEDASTVRKDNAPENLSLLKKIVLNLLRMDTTDKVKSSLRLKRKRAAWDDELRMRFLGLRPL